ncbi:uncharacterized protein LOC134245564 [Saccostrea cucullata]|uniref:uncharacterized protein LOC134245564 n=1 Tax=Saccostrea cuccullata TaxID=36930 RepID=UPI002ED5A389
MMQAQVLSAVLNEVKILRTINYGQKYITDLKYSYNGNVCVSVINMKNGTPIWHISSHRVSFGQRRGIRSSINFLTSHGSCMCLRREGLRYLFLKNGCLMSSDKDMRINKFWPSSDELLGEYTPNGLAVCRSGAILVSLWNHQVHDRSLGKVIKVSSGGSKALEIETDKNRPLFICPTYIAENGNEDICVSDVNTVVVTDAGGFLRFRYTAAQSDPQFDPYGICCDSKNNIIVADMVKNRIHMIDQNSELLRYIHYSDMSMPRVLCIDEEDNLYVGEWLSEEIKVLSPQ